MKQNTQFAPAASAPVDSDALVLLRQKIGIPGRFVVFDMDAEPARFSYEAGAGTLWHFGVRGETHGIDPVALHMERAVAEFLAAALNVVSGTGAEKE
jgi:hypothetical protein